MSPASATSSSSTVPPGMEDCVHRDSLPAYDPYDSYERLFVAENVDKQSYLDRMTHFDLRRSCRPCFRWRTA